MDPSTLDTQEAGLLQQLANIRALTRRLHILSTQDIDPR